MATPPHVQSESGDGDANVLLNPRKAIRRFVRDVETPGTFAVGSSLLAPPADLTVEGLGNIRLPLTSENVAVLRAASELAPYGHGAETKVDESVRRAWQIDGASIGLSKEFTEAVGQRHALRAAEKLGLRARALGVEARLYKLVMYETGGHFKPHKDTEKEAGMFGTLVVQLPTYDGHEGGTLVVRHRGMQQSFAWEDPDGSYHERASAAGAAAGAAAATVPGEAGADVASSSPPSLPVRCAAFYGDCEHELLPVTSGVRLCLLYNLVRTTPGPPPVAAVGQEGSAAQLRLSDAVAAWSRPDGRCGTSKFILPLEHEYTRTSLSFGGLKGRDRAVADALRSCRGLDLYLATVEKHEHGTAEGQYGFGRRGRSGLGCNCGLRKRPRKCYYDSDYQGEDEEEEEEEEEEKEEEEEYCDGYCDVYFSDAEDQAMDYDADVETTVTAKNWVGSDDNAVALNLPIDLDREVLDCDEEEDSDEEDSDEPFYENEAMDLLFPSGAEPDRRAYEGYTGNYSPSLEFWYHRSVLVLWPASATMRTALRCGAGTALTVARQRSVRYGATDPLSLADLAVIVSLSTGFPKGRAFVKDADHTASVLALCAGAGAAALDSSRRFLQLLAGGAAATVGTPGLDSEEVARAVAGLVGAVGWPAVGNEVVRLAKACSLEQSGCVALLARSLSTFPQQQSQQQQEPHQNACAGSASSSSSAGAVIAGAYADGVASDPDALERVTAKGAAGIVRLLLLPCCNGSASDANPALLSFASVGSVRLQTDVLAAAVFEFRRQLEINAGAGEDQSLPPPGHSTAVAKLSTNLTSRGFRTLHAAAVKNFAEDVIWLAARADGAGGLEQEFAGALLTDVRSGDSDQVHHSQEQLKAVLKSEIVQAAVRGVGSGVVSWRTLASERLRKVDAHTQPVLCWRQPNAQLGEHPQVEQFLRGPERQMTYTRSGTFSNIAQARNFSNKHFSSYFGSRRNLSATCLPQGRGRSTYVTITKSTELFDKKRRAYGQDKAEAVVLRALLSSSNGNDVCSTESGGCVGDGGAGGSGGSRSSGGASGVGRTPWLQSLLGAETLSAVWRGWRAAAWR